MFNNILLSGILLIIVNNCSSQYFIGNNHFRDMKQVFFWNQIGYNVDGVLLYDVEARRRITLHVAASRFHNDNCPALRAHGKGLMSVLSISIYIEAKGLSIECYRIKFKVKIQDTKDSPFEKKPGSIVFEEEVKEEDQFFFQYNNIPIGFEVYENRAFVTVPRRRYGIISTLNYVELNSSSSSPLLKPYPSSGSISSLVSVYRPRVDVCGRLWVVDTGLLEYPNNFMQKQPSKIIVYDLKTNKEIFTYEIPSDVLDNGTTSGLTSITVDVTPTSCDDAFAYINDLAKNGLIVFSLKQLASWRFTHSSFNYDVGATNFKVSGFEINWKDGIFSIALSDPNSEGIRTAYYHPLISTQEFSITTDILKNKSADFDKHYKLEGVRGAWSQSGSHDYHSSTKTLLFANVAQDGIMCWNTGKPLFSKISNLIVQSHEEMVYISDLKVRGDDVWVLVNQIPVFIYAKLIPFVSNFYIFRGKVQELIQDSTCM